MTRRRGEFGEESGNLGELPEDITSERMRVKHARLRKYRTSSRQDAIGDIKYQAKSNFQTKEVGTVSYKSQVTSTYDSRPVNSQDFLSTIIGEFTVHDSNPSEYLSLTVKYNIPGGFIAVLRGYRYQLIPLVPLEHDGLILDIKTSNVSQLGYKNLKHGKYLKDFSPCFLLSDTGSSIDFFFQAPNGLNSILPAERKIIVEVYGNLIQITGSPLALEIANKQTEQEILK